MEIGLSEDHIVGMMWNKNEGDILEEIIWEALPHVDSLFIADDGSTDHSWDIIRSMQRQHAYKIEHIQRKPNKVDKAQRQSLLNQIRKRYKPNHTLVQIIESDIMILDTDIRKAFKERSRGGVMMNWVALNAARKGHGSWEGADSFPHWPVSIKQVMPMGHYMEEMTYTFRPFPELHFRGGVWRPWPAGFSHFNLKKEEVTSDYTPLLAHYGYRGPTHVHLKYKGQKLRRYPSWDFTSPETVADTVYYFNGVWNSNGFPMSRQGWKNRKDAGDL